MSKLIVIMGTTGTGKSPYIEKIIGETNNCYVWDSNDEYGARPKYPGRKTMNLSNNENANRSRHIAANKSQFVANCLKKHDTICVFEDATGFFRGRQSAEVEIMIGKKLFNRNTYVFVFHSINRCPPFFVELADYVVLFPTNDQDETVKSKYASIYPFYLKRKQTNQPFINIKTIP